MDKNLFINASEVVDMLDVSKPYAYKLIQQFNKELAEKRLSDYSRQSQQEIFQGKDVRIE